MKIKKFNLVAEESKLEFNHIYNKFLGTYVYDSAIRFHMPTVNTKENYESGIALLYLYYNLLIVS